MSTTAHLPAQRLGEFLVFLSRVTAEEEAVQVAVERAASALEAEVAVVVMGDLVAASVGFAAGRVPVDALRAVVAEAGGVLPVPGAGDCLAAVAPLTRQEDAHLLVARSDAAGFSADELGLLRGMARALELTLETLRTLAAERRRAAENDRLLASLQQRQRLLEQISDIQRAITRRAPLQEILDAITTGAHRLLGDDLVGLRMRDPDDAAVWLLVSSHGLEPAEASELWRSAGPGARVGSAGANQHGPGVLGVEQGIAAPVYENDVAVGSLEIGSRRPGRVFSGGDREVLRVFAEHVSLAVTDARTHEALRQAFHDPLTGLASRRLFMDRLDHALAASERTGGRVAVLFVDLDRFKIVNDSLGHAAGDSLLVGVAGRIRSCVRDDDLAARLGGDEFGVVLVDVADEAAAVRVAEQVIDTVRAPFQIDGKETFVDVSVGIALDGDGDRCGSGLVRNADLAMYHAKRNGKGRSEVFHPALRAALASRLALESELRHAADRDELVLHYQPIIELDTGRVIAVEALLRWQHPQRGLLPPREFIPLAEETGLILPLDRWALTHACRQVSAWNAARPHDPLTVNVNLSVRQLHRPDLPDVVARTLLDSGLRPGNLVLELTESLLLPGTHDILDRLRELRRMRVRLAIDDFGTGYSSLAYLRHLPVDLVKIDKTFVDEITGGPAASGLSRAVVQLGRTLGLVTLAEGIEAGDQLAALRDAGCDLGQGFFFGKPLTAAETAPLILGGL